MEKVEQFSHFLVQYEKVVGLLDGLEFYLVISLLHCFIAVVVVVVVVVVIGGVGGGGRGCLGGF